MSLMYKIKSTGPNTELCGTPNVMFDIEELEILTETYCLFPITQIRLEPAQHDTSDAIMLELTHQYIVINCIECLSEIQIYSNSALFYYTTCIMHNATTYVIFLWYTQITPSHHTQDNTYIKSYVFIHIIPDAWCIM